MALLKEDGSLDVERIQELPYKEYLHALSNFTKERYDEYVSKIQKNSTSG